MRVGKRPLQGMKAVGEDGDEPLPGAGNDPAAGDAAGVAAEAHGHGEALPPAGARRPEAPIHAEGHSGQIPGVLQQREQGKEDGHGGSITATTHATVR